MSQYSNSDQSIPTAATTGASRRRRRRRLALGAKEGAGAFGGTFAQWTAMATLYKVPKHGADKIMIVKLDRHGKPVGKSLVWDGVQPLTKMLQEASTPPKTTKPSTTAELWEVFADFHLDE